MNCIAPGMLPCEMTTGDGVGSQKSKIEREAGPPVGRFGEEKDMAFLAGPAGTFLNGQIIYPEYPDGGKYPLLAANFASVISLTCFAGNLLLRSMPSPEFDPCNEMQLENPHDSPECFCLNNCDIYKLGK